MKAACVILASDDRWRLAVRRDGATELIDLPVSEGPAGPEAGLLAAALATAGGRGRPVMLVIPGRWVLAARVSADKGARRNRPPTSLRAKRRQALCYRLEEQLPLPAEEFVADFAAPDAAGTVLGCAVPVRRLAGAVAALEAAGVRVAHICPAALLAIQRSNGSAPAGGGVYVAVPWDGRIDLIGLSDGALCFWQNVSAAPGRVEQALWAEQLLDGLVVGHEIATLGDPIEAVVVAACDVLAGRRAPLMDFRRDALAPADRLAVLRRPLRAAVLAVLLLLATATAATLWRARQHAALSEELSARRQDAYLELFAGRAAPVAVRRHLENELRRLGALRMVTAETPERRSALDQLRDLAARLPGEVRLRILDVRIEPDGLIVEGQARTHGDAEKIAAGLRTGPGAPGLVEPPRTERLERGGVAFTLAVKRKEASP